MDYKPTKPTFLIRIYFKISSVVSSKAKLLWPPYTSIQAINFLFFPSSSPLLVYSYLTIYNVNIL